MSAAGHALWHALDKPNDWQFDPFCVTHLPSNQAFWIANGPFFFNGYSFRGTVSCIGWIERHWIYWKAVGLQGRLVAMRLKGEL